LFARLGWLWVGVEYAGVELNVFEVIAVIVLVMTIHLCYHPFFLLILPLIPPSIITKPYNLRQELLIKPFCQLFQQFTIPFYPPITNKPHFIPFPNLLFLQFFFNVLLCHLLLFFQFFFLFLQTSDKLFFSLRLPHQPVLQEV
jgi:hypothetical protein